MATVNIFVGFHKEIYQGLWELTHTRDVGGSKARITNEALKEYLALLDDLHGDPNLLLNELSYLYGIIRPNKEVRFIVIGIWGKVFERLKFYTLSYGIKPGVIINEALRAYLTKYGYNMPRTVFSIRPVGRAKETVLVHAKLRDIVMQSREPILKVAREALNKYTEYFESLDSRGKLFEVIAMNNRFVREEKAEIGGLSADWILTKKYNLRKSYVVDRALAWYLRDVYPEPYELRTRAAQMILVSFFNPNRF